MYCSIVRSFVCNHTPTAGTELKRSDRVFKPFISVENCCLFLLVVAGGLGLLAAALSGLLVSWAVCLLALPVGADAGRFARIFRLNFICFCLSLIGGVGWNHHTIYW